MHRSFIMVAVLGTLVGGYGIFLTIVGVYFRQQLAAHHWQDAAQTAQHLAWATAWVPTLCDPCTTAFPGSRVFGPIILVHYGSRFAADSLILLDQGQSLLRSSLSADAEALEQTWPPFQARAQTWLDQLSEHQARFRLYQLEKYLVRLSGFNLPFSLTDGMEAMHAYSPLIRELLELTPDLIGLYQSQPRTYTILLQNSKELRPTGGFIGSYAQLRFESGVLKELSAQDIYVPDGAISGHVEPPEPIATAFKQGFWRLRDSNWDANFETAVKTIGWFFEKGGVALGDGVVAINLEVIEALFKELGPIQLPDYQRQVTADTLYMVAQAQVEQAFFPGSTQKKDFMQHLFNQLRFELTRLDVPTYLVLGRIGVDYLAQRNIQVWMKNPSLEHLVKRMQWGGHLPDTTHSRDSVAIIDANLGANKANCCVTRTVAQVITQTRDSYLTHITLTYTNKSPVSRPQPPKYWGGDYRNYLRLYVPQAAQLAQVTVDRKPIKSQVDIAQRQVIALQSWGLWVLVPHGQTSTVEVNYRLPRGVMDPYQLFVFKQSGIAYWHTVEYQPLQGVPKITKRWIDRDQLMSF